MREQRPILVLEDDQVDIMILKRAFKKLEIKNDIHICQNGEEGLDWLRNHTGKMPGVILLDLNMPKMNGHEFLATVKNDKDLKLIPVIILTTSKSEEDRYNSFSNHCAGYMVKPTDYKDFLLMLDSIRTYWKTSELAS